jgi:hypothetical protein
MIYGTRPSAERTAGGHINLTGHLDHGDAAVETVVQQQPIRHVSGVHRSFLLTGGPLPNVTALL